MPRDVVGDGGIEGPDLRGAFDRARGPRMEKKPEKPKLVLELKPPAPVGMGAGSTPLVSPALRGERKKAELKRTMLMAREFRSRARDGFER